MREKRRTPSGAADRRIRVGDWLMPYDDATTEVRLNRTLVDVLTATAGSDTDCMNSRCIRAQRNAHVFPHPVYVVSTIKSRVYVVDRLTDDGQPAHAVRYELSKGDSRAIIEHDRDGVGTLGELRLLVPRDPKGSPLRRAAGGGGRFEDVDGRYSGGGQRIRDARPVTSRGALQRYKVAVGALNPSGD